MNGVKNVSCVSSFMIITHISKNVRNKWGENINIKQSDDGVYICTCTVTNVDIKYKESHAFVNGIY